MNKLIIVESGDRLGKGSLIKGLCEYYDYKNIIVRHCDKPLKNLSLNEVLDFQFKCFEQEFQLIDYISHIDKKYCYHNNIIIYDRFYLGEYVYGSLFRNGNSDQIRNKILYLEKNYLRNNFLLEFYLITLTSDPKFFLSKEDGNSFSKNLDEKTKELQLFKDAYEFSLIKNKLLVKVDQPFDLTGTIEFNFKSKQEILNEVLNFLNK